MSAIKNKTIVFGHRGYPAKFAENSLAGFRNAIEHGVEGVEFDVQLTKDGVPVVMHDERVDRTTDGKGYLKDFTLKQLRQVHLANGEPVPELRELFDLLNGKDILINLEFKTGIIHYPEIEKTVLSLAKQYQFAHPLIYSSFDYVTLKNCQEIDPNQAYCYLLDQGVTNAAKLIKENHFAGIHPSELLASQETITQRIWTVDDPVVAKRYFQEHVAGIFTNNFPLMVKLRDQVQGADKLAEN
ncbi:glycerophosphodiester phosphodiesterase family protein [Lactobacillus sp. ESL0701]|uniref:glycerophosphodiester phosphodiesterase family protein n=1 Tax=Lactobacillus sp. ESL0701 TaxID=2983217 RepID=UPI0023F80248|nr:glycerophosphodiester phosphodiesterase family protein [Lactobacillus sp. ESL0701]MDF7672992.1 glycerophosphodiester phosphodiesterase family protein [Lactobacillus sp. ESL0701]